MAKAFLATDGAPMDTDKQTLDWILRRDPSDVDFRIGVHP
jgi:hypothetical protein